MHAVEIRHAVKTYANGFTALNDVSFTVAEGEFFALLGPNGAGKTTLISAMAGLGRLTSGSISVMGHDVVKSARASRMNLGVVPQELVFDAFFTVRETLRFQSGYFGIKNNDKWVDEIIGRLGLADKADTITRNLSGGMKRRVMVAQALVHKPPVIVLDEPTAGVDVELRQSLWTFINSLNAQGHTVILTTHYLEEAQNLCSRIAMLKHGSLVALDTTDHLLHEEKGLRVALQLSDGLPDVLRPLQIGGKDGEILLKLNDYNELSGVLDTLKTAGVGVQHMALPETDLEEVFMKLTK
ncbi:ABC transporter ATP-binding protein [Neisseria chenwenguii]|uniref:ABC transporter ATP-binding protein n=1 Tax=Neisseria chenwenguii TaxID=1853278 RepID=A0A220S1C1_9NEIS|nr:ABC transporter ATP-binding protein [Neisseria chenwenguii]ASK27281.1 ABC transporter ATP-binding protein [Neisseria chenwenguii]ROV57044.1 ABC transporter ATP-binding protein [Neisseria chenwenguii]